MSKVTTRSNTRNLKTNKSDKTISTAQSTKGVTSSANTSYITIKYDYDSDDSKDTSKNIIENLRNKLAQQQAINEVIVQEKQTLLEDIKDLKREIFNKNEIISTLQKTLDNLPINKLLMNVQTQTEIDRPQEVYTTLRDDIAKMEEKNKQLRQDINRYIKQIEEMNKQRIELKQMARSMLTTTIVPNTEEDKYTKEVNMLQTPISGSRLETTNQPDQYLVEQYGGTSGVESMIQLDTSEQQVHYNLTGKRRIVLAGDVRAQNVSKYLNFSESDFVTEGIVKPNADFDEIGKTVTSHWSNCGENDIIIIIIKSSSICNYKSLKRVLKHLLLCSKSTNLVLLINFDIPGDSLSKTPPPKTFPILYKRDT
nr:unnamed protein product [Callosobruchus analis]